MIENLKICLLEIIFYILKFFIVLVQKLELLNVILVQVLRQILIFNYNIDKMKKLMFIDRINFLSFRSNFGLLRFKNLKIVRKIFFFFRVEKFLLVFFIKFFFFKVFYSFK